MFNGIPDFHQSVEMMKNMWANAAKTGTDGSSTSFNFPGMSSLNPFGIPMVDMEELDKRIKDLKSVEAWLSMNLNILQTTIQGLEVQKATLSALHGIAETMKSASTAEKTTENTDTEPMTPNMAEFAGASGKLAQELMEHMSKSMTNMMAAFPNQADLKPAAKKAAPAKKTSGATTAAKTAKRPARPRRA
jgi:uncharacterized protein YjgD (DUF1641 family)